MSEHMESISRELEALRNKQGKFVPSECVEWARSPPQSALAGHLIWDNELAGERYRVWQVRELLAVHIVDPDGERRFVSLSIDRNNGGGYRSLADVMKRPDLKAIMLQDALADLQQLQRRYERLTAELADVWKATDKVRQRHQPKEAA